MEEEGTKARRWDEFTGPIIGACIEVHRHLGPGLLESAYEHALAHELRLRGLRFQRQLPLPLQYKGVPLEGGYRLDVVVEGHVIVEVKALQRLLPVHEAQVITYLRLSAPPYGLRVHFHLPALIQGLKRLVNGILNPFVPSGLPVDSSG